MKMFKRNAVIIVVLLFVCAAVYLNWTYGKDDDTVDTQASVSEDAQDAAVENTDAGDDGLYYNDSTGDAETAAYFDQVRLDRTEARDTATTTLQTASTTEGASQEAIDDAVAQIQKLAEWTVKEAEMESLIMAKGFDDCVVYMSDDGIKVTVAVPETGLSDADVARITDVVVTETDYTAAQLQIIEIN